MGVSMRAGHVSSSTSVDEAWGGAGWLKLGNEREAVGVLERGCAVAAAGDALELLLSSARAREKRLTW
jgi:hypothetical protein